MDDWKAGGFGLYIHWPFCEAKCPYCDFNSHVAARIDQGAWKRAYLREIERVASETGGRVLQSVFFGGGTPSLMAPETAGEVLSSIKAKWAVANDFEVTLEANPSSVEAARFRDFRAAGINRVSVGVQALNDEDLRRLGRLHTSKEARGALEIAQACFDRVSFDLIYARQGQSLADWSKELDEALGIGVDHLSLYQLTIEPGTAFGARHRAGGLKGLPDEDLSADLFALTQDKCGAAGLPAYEISNHAADLAQSRHNLIYWKGGDFGGIGPGAHGRVTIDGQRWATVGAMAPQDWLSAIDMNGSGEVERVAVSRQEQGEEYLMMGLRLTEGVDLARAEALLDAPVNPAAIAQLIDLGMIERSGQMVRTTPSGRPVLNALLRELLV